MKLIKISGHPYDVGFHHNMVKTGVIKTNVHHVNIEEISSITKWKGELLNEGKTGTEIRMNNGDAFIDARDVDEFLEYLDPIYVTL